MFTGFRESFTSMKNASMLDSWAVSKRNGIELFCMPACLNVNCNLTKLCMKD